MVISNHYSFRVLFDKITSVYYIWKNMNILALEMASPGNRYCAICIGALSYSYPIEISFSVLVKQTSKQLDLLCYAYNLRSI